jgi:hypothetical protein
MTEIFELIPELKCWNHGKGIAPENWIFIEGRADHALAFSSLLWPDFVQFESYVLRGPIDLDRLKGWEHGGASRRQIETAMNMFALEGIFQQDQADKELKDRQIERLADIMIDMFDAKLRRKFPARRFSAFLINDEDDFGVSFCQV